MHTRQSQEDMPLPDRSLRFERCVGTFVMVSVIDEAVRRCGVMAPPCKSSPEALAGGFRWIKDGIMSVLSLPLLRSMISCSSCLMRRLLSTSSSCRTLMVLDSSRLIRGVTMSGVTL